MNQKEFLISLILILSFFGLPALNNAQVFITPDKDINAKIEKGIINPLELFGISKTDEGIVVSPKIENGWTWLAAKDVQFNGKVLNFFFADGRIYTKENIRTQFRRVKFNEGSNELIPVAKKGEESTKDKNKPGIYYK